jgi:hypothetical protein
MTTIVAQKVWTAKAGKKFGSIVDPTGARFMLPVGMQDAFVEGQTYEVPTSQKKWGEDVVTVIEGRPGSAGSGAIAQPTPQPSAPAPRPAYNGNGNGGDSRDVQIATIALMKSFIEAGKVELKDLDLVEKVCMASARSIVAGSK